MKILSPYIVRVSLVLLAIVLVVPSLLFFNRMAEQIAEEEGEKIELWAKATERVILAGPNEDITFPMEIVEHNTTIPVFMVDAEGNYLFSRNVDVPQRIAAKGEEATQAYMQKQVDKLRKERTPIEVRISHSLKQYIYYDDSRLLKMLTYYPYVNVALFLALFLVALVSIVTAQKAEKDRVWAGLSKETAHQLGTPISSLNGWIEILRSTGQDETMVAEMEKDLKRLSVIAERFSKVGSVPDIQVVDLVTLVRETVAYMKNRTSSRINIQIVSPDELLVPVSPVLFSWVIENLMRNAVDAMAGEGELRLTLSEEKQWTVLDVQDNGKGIARKDRRRVFVPGFTTKKRGWGMGLSLCQRIVNDFHKGKIFVLQSEPGVGTTFRIQLRKK